MEFHQKRRQQFLGEKYYQEQIAEVANVIGAPDGLEANLRLPESEAGWHSDLARGVGFEKFNRLLLHYTAGESIDSLRGELEEVIAAYERGMGNTSGNIAETGTNSYWNFRALTSTAS